MTGLFKCQQHNRNTCRARDFYFDRRQITENALNTRSRARRHQCPNSFMDTVIGSSLPFAVVASSQLARYVAIDKKYFFFFTVHFNSIYGPQLRTIGDLSGASSLVVRRSVVATATPRRPCRRQRK